MACAADHERVGALSLEHVPEEEEARWQAELTENSCSVC
jgi:hypothetical protein